MAERLDVAGRLAEGQPAVEHTQAYVRACQELGYDDPELTSRPSQITDWYDAEQGLDLHALDGDCAQLRAAAGAVTDALRMQRAQVDELAAAWTGPGAESALAFLQRHCDAANAVATEIRAAAQRCESLRDNLWHLVDVKVATAIAIDDRTAANRPAWLAAAMAVTSGDRTADELVQRQIKPYVDNDIRAEWLTAMRSARAGVATAYDMVIDKFAAAAPVYFEIPEDVTPGRAPFQPAPASTPAVIATLAPAPAPAPERAAAEVSTPPAPAVTSAPPAPLMPPPKPSMSDLAAGLGDSLPAGLGGTAGPDWLGGLGGLGGLANRIVDELSGLLGSAGDETNDPPGLDDRLDTDDKDDKADKADKADADRESDVEPDPPDQSQTVAAEEAKPDDAPPPASGPPPIDAPPPAATPPVDAPAPPPMAAAPSDTKTPCEIAADELPKAGQ